MAASPADITPQVAQAVTMTPLTWEYHSVLFNLEGLDTTFTEGYEERHGIPFGSKRIVTKNAVDKGEKKLITIRTAKQGNNIYHLRFSENMAATRNVVIR
jgi:hypothetical protein